MPDFIGSDARQPRAVSHPSTSFKIIAILLAILKVFMAVVGASNDVLPEALDMGEKTAIAGAPLLLVKKAASGRLSRTLEARGGVEPPWKDLQSSA